MVRAALWLIIVISMLPKLAFAEQPCPQERYFADLLDFAEEGIHISKELALKDIASFCRATTKNQAQLDLKREMPNMNFLSDQDIKDMGIDQAWIRAYHPDKEIRLDAFRKQNKLNARGITDFDSAISYLNNPKPVSADQNLNQFGVEGKPDEAPLEAMKGFGNMNLIRFAACNELVFGTECPGALEKAIQMSLPVRNVTQVHLYKEIMYDKKYDEGLRLAAIKVVERAKSGKSSGARLFDDIKDSFAKAGAEEKIAAEMTWKTMGLLATGGANTGDRFFKVYADQAAIPKKVAITILATLPIALESDSIKDGEPYSYPKGIKSTCDSGKPYHFWLTAYLAWELSRTGTGAKGAAAAAFLSNKGYQMMSNTPTRHPTKPMQEDFLGPYTNSIRMDLAIASAGAVYGANYGKGISETTLDIDEGVRRTVRASEPVDKLTAEQSKALFNSPISFGWRWTKLMAPNEAFSLYKDKL